MKHPEPIRRAIEAFLILPGIGRRTAERFAYALMQARPESVNELANAAKDLRSSITTCAICGQWSETTPCSICGDTRRDQSTLVIVSDSRNIIPIEQTSQYHGLYFVLGGLIDPIEGVNITNLRFDQLIARVSAGVVKEVILAFDVDVKGEATVLYTKRLLQSSPIKITRLARGLPTGSQLEYADEVTLASALAGRREA